MNSKRKALLAKYGEAAVTFNDPWYMELYTPVDNVIPEEVARYVIHRAGLVHGQGVETSDNKNFTVLSNEYVMPGPFVPDYGSTFVSIATFPFGAPPNIML